MGRLILIGGGNLKEKTTFKIDKYITSLVSNKPNVLFIPTASKDSTRVIDNFKTTYDILANVDTLCLTKDDDINKVNWADIIYIGGGSTKDLLNIWKEKGFDKVIKRLYDDNKIIAGMSAGAICFFEYGLTDTNAFYDNGYCNYELIECLGIIKGMCTPHYNIDGKEVFNLLVKQKGIRGFAIEDNAALCLFDDKIYSIKSENKNSVYLFDELDNLIMKEVK